MPAPIISPRPPGVRERQHFLLCSVGSSRYSWFVHIVMIPSTKGHRKVTRVLSFCDNVITIQMLRSEVNLDGHLSRYGHLVCGQKVYWLDQLNIKYIKASSP